VEEQEEEEMPRNPLKYVVPFHWSIEVSL
jgi:hypothetical protein